MRSLTLQSPAKINLFLKITSRRRDGFHNMVTLFHRISLVDTLRLTKKPEGVFSLTCSHPKVPTGEKNLITRAYRALQEEFPHLGGVSVKLTKRIPAEGGLGGGSSNAAHFLIGMKKLYRLRLSEGRMFKIAQSLGADVPFFLKGCRQALGTERGDRIRSLPFSGRLWFLLVLSNKGLRTKKVFSKLVFKPRGASLTKANQTVRILCKFLKAKDLRQISGLLCNDLEDPAFQLRPSLRKIKTHFESRGVLTSRMSGSGATVFAIFASQKEAKRQMRSLQKAMPSKKLVICHTF